MPFWTMTLIGTGFLLLGLKGVSLLYPDETATGLFMRRLGYYRRTETVTVNNEPQS